MLGVCITSQLSWSDHISNVCCKAYASLFLLRRVLPANVSPALFLKLYKVLVRSQLSYCSQIWRPVLIKDIVSLERIQRKATKFILCGHSLDYKDLLLSLCLLPLMHWLEIQDLLFLVRCFKEPTDNFDITSYVSFSTASTRSSGSHKLHHKYSRTSTTRHFYFNRIVRLWNSFPPIDLSASFEAIKRYIYGIFWEHFVADFNPDFVCSFHYSCPCYACLQK